MKLTALVIGATGLVGRALVDKLLARDEIARVITLTRRPLEIKHSKYVNHCINFSQLESKQSLFEGVDIFCSCLGTTKNQAGSIAAQRVVDLDYQYLAAQLARQAGISHYLLVSSSGANARSLSPYLKMKGELEDKIKALNFPRTSIFQPSLLLGKREQTRFAEGLGARCLPLLAYLPYLKRFRPISGDQVAERMLQVAVSDKAQASSSGQLDYWVLEQIF